jgi:tRNA(adenine34) deaminase
MWHELSGPWQACIDQAWQAYCSGSVPIGAAIADGEGQVLAVGRNRIFEPRAAAHPYIAGNRLAHAEVNAVLTLDNSIDAHTCILYTTTEPCPLCVGALTMANIRCFHYASRDPWAGSAELIQCSRYISSKKIQVVGPESATMEAILVGIMTEYHQRKVGPDGAGRVVASWNAVMPEGVRLGRRLFKSGDLQRYCEELLPASSVIDQLSRELVDAS